MRVTVESSLQQRIIRRACGSQRWHPPVLADFELVAALHAARITLAPRQTSSRTVTATLPELAPVTIATSFTSSRSVISSFLRHLFASADGCNSTGR